MSAASTFPPPFTSLPLADAVFVALSIMTTTAGVGVAVPINVSFSLVHRGVNNKTIGKMKGKDRTNRPNGTKISFTISALMARITGILASKPAVTATTTDLRSPKLANPSVCKMSPITPVIISSLHSGEANKPSHQILEYDDVLKKKIKVEFPRIHYIMRALLKLSSYHNRSFIHQYSVDIMEFQ